MTSTQKKIIAELTNGVASNISRTARLTGSTPATVKKVRDYALANGLISVTRFNGCNVAYKLNNKVTYCLDGSNAVVSSATDDVFHLDVSILQDICCGDDVVTQKVHLQISRELLDKLKEVPTGISDYENGSDYVPFF